MSALRPMRALLLAAGLAGAGPVAAQDDVERLIAQLDIAATVEVMREEGVRYGAEVAREMLPDAKPEGWQAVMARIYDTDRMLPLIADGLAEGLGQTDLAPLLDFFGSEAGQQIVQHEIAARRAFLDPQAEDAARRLHADMQAEGAPLLARIDRLIEESDLIELNVMGALNANIMFYRGLTDGGAYEMTEAEMLADVWSQEADIRRDTTDWLHAFLTMAYRPLPSERLDAYGALYRTPEGRALNRALFLAFDEMYEEISYLMGRAVAQYAQSEKL